MVCDYLIDDGDTGAHRKLDVFVFDQVEVSGVTQTTASRSEPETRQDLAESLRLASTTLRLASLRGTPKSLRFASPRNFRDALAFSNFLSFSIVVCTTVR